MKAFVEIPSFLSHLKRDSRNYPIPFFVGYVDGIPDFRLLDAAKQRLCIEKNLCSICGKKLFKESYYFISGPLGAQNCISTDTAMHKECAEFSLSVCPHLHLEKSTRRDTGDLYKELEARQSAVAAKEKPSVLFLVRARKFKAIPHPAANGFLIKFDPIYKKEFRYKNGKLEAWNSEPDVQLCDASKDAQ